MDGRADIQVARPVFSLRHESEDLRRPDQHRHLPDQGSSRPEALSLLDGDYIPPSLRYDVHPAVPDFLAELEGKLESIAASGSATS